MSQPSHQVNATPRWTTLALLGTAVLGLHLWLLLGDGLTNPGAPPHPIAPTAPNAAATETRSAGDTVPPAPAQPARATASTVRWIVATAPPPVALPTPKPTPGPPVAPPEPSPPPPPARTTLAAAPTALEGTRVAEDAARGVTTDTPAALPPQEESPLTQASVGSSSVGLTASPTQALTPPAAPETEAAAITASTPLPAQAQPERNEPLPPAQPPGSTQLAYVVTGNVKGINYRASGTLDWIHADGRYSARMEVRMPLLGRREQTSAGRVDGSGLLPGRFSDKSRSERAAHFDHAQQTIRFSNNQPDAPLQPGAQDRLSLFMQLAGLFNARPAAFPAGQTISLQVAGTSDAEIWRFRIGETETLDLPAGTLQAQRLMREPRQPHDSRIDIWLAPDLAYLPVRIRITQDNGDRVDQQLSQMP